MQTQATPTPPPGDTAIGLDTSRWLNQQIRPGAPLTRWAVCFGLLQAVAVIGQAWLLAYVLHALIIETRPLDEVRNLFLALPLAILLRVAAGLAREEAGLRAARRVRDALRTRLLDQAHRLGPAWHAGQQGGVFVTRLLEQVDALEGYVARYLPQRWLAVLVPLLIVAVVVPANPVAAAILFVTAPLIPLFMTVVGHTARKRQMQQFEALARMSGQFLETLRGLVTLRLHDAHLGHAAVVERNAEAFRVRTMRVLRLAFLSGGVLEFLASLAIALCAVYLGFGLLGHLEFGFADGQPTLLVALFVLLLAPEFYLPLRELGSHYHARAEALAAAEPLRDMLETTGSQPSGGTRMPPDGAPRIVIDRIGFAHREGVAVLDDFSLTIQAGEAVALTGPSGSGKTTLLRLLLGQHTPSAGQIEVDGTPLGEYDLTAWREHIGWMSQHPRLAAASLGDNLRLARLDATDDALIEALSFAGLGEWYAALAAGLETRLGEGGRAVSGGQLRRIALARLRLRPTRLLLLDEPTASLDRETERIVVDRLAVLRQGRTLVLLTHRNAPLSIVDRVVRLQTPSSPSSPSVTIAATTPTTTLAAPLTTPRTVQPAEQRHVLA